MSVFVPKPVSLSMKRLTSGILVFWVLFATIFSGLEPAASASIPVEYPVNPMPAHTGGFGEKSCHSCHSDFELNPEGGSLEFGWDHAAVRPGREHVIRMSLTHADMLRAGFQLSARFADGPHAGKQAGHFVASPTHHALSEQEGISYLSQSLQGGLLTKPGQVDWTATWVAPRGRHRVVFHVSAVGGDKDGSAYGDWVYVSEFRPRH
jgi:hypothetical protein